MLEFNGVGKNFGGLSVLRYIDLKIPEGGIFGLIGPNGAGKTTVFNLLTGLLQPTTGSIVFTGNELQGIPPHRIARLGIARTFQNIRIFKQMTVLENVMVGMHDRLEYSVPALMFGFSTFRRIESAAREQAREILNWFDLADKAALPAASLSYGEQRKLEFARALATQPKLLLLDEPVAGMNAVEKTILMAEILKIQQRGFSIFLIEHDMRFVMNLCTRIAVLNFGTIIAEGTPAEIQSNQDVIEAYLGRDES